MVDCWLVILCGGWLGGLPGLSCKTQVLVVCNVLVALEIVKTLNLIDSTWLYQGKRTKFCHFSAGSQIEIEILCSMWLCWPENQSLGLRFLFKFPSDYFDYFGCYKEGGVESKGSSPIKWVRWNHPSPSWWRWTSSSLNMSCHPWWVLGWSMMSSQDDTLDLPEMEQICQKTWIRCFFGCETSRHAIELICLGKLQRPQPRQPQIVG